MHAHAHTHTHTHPQGGQEKPKGNSVLKGHQADQLNQADACLWKQKPLKVKKDMKL